MSAFGGSGLLTGLAAAGGHSVGRLIVLPASGFGTRNSDATATKWLRKSANVLSTCKAGGFLMRAYAAARSI